MKLVIRISTNCYGGYDYFEKTEQELMDDYCIYNGRVFERSYVKTIVPGGDLTWMNDVIDATPAELFNYELFSSDDEPTLNYCKQAYAKKYSYIIKS